jgi:hypothetical protein
MDEVVEIVVVIPTSSRSSKMESGCKSYYLFSIAISSRPDIIQPGRGRII